MKKILVINGGQKFAHSGATFNKSLVEWDQEVLTAENGFQLEITDINETYDPEVEVQKFVNADVIIYHTPVWWFGLPHKFKEYLDLVLTAGHNKGLYHSDGRSSKNPAINYGTGGQLHGRKYMLTTTWNAPDTAFTLPGEFFNQRSVDDGVMFGFHRMNRFLGMEKLDGFHFHDLEKNATPQRVANYISDYKSHLSKLFLQVEEPKLI